MKREFFTNFVKQGMAAQKVTDELILKSLKATPNYNPKCPSCEKRRLTNVIAVRRSRKAKAK